jgi:hypothetical protein
MPDQNSPCWALPMMQRRKILAAVATAVSNGKLLHPKSLLFTRVERLKERSATWRVTATDGGNVTISAASCSRPTKTTDDVLFIDCFLGGNRLHLSSDATLEYSLAPGILTLTAKKYNLTSLVVIVHAD